jgi:hypothetical protein
LYIGGPRIGHKVQDAVDLTPHYVLYIGAPKPPNRLDFPSTDFVLYIGAPGLGPRMPPSACRVVSGHVIGVGFPVSAQVAGMLLEPPAGLGIKPLIDIRVGLHIAPVRLVMAGFPALLPRTGLGRPAPPIRNKIMTAIMAVLNRPHGDTSALLVRQKKTDGKNELCRIKSAISVQSIRRALRHYNTG